MNERTEKIDIPQEKYEWNTKNIPYYESKKIHQQINRKDRHKQQFDEDGKFIESIDDGFQKPSDKDAQGNVLTEEELALTNMNDSHHTSKQTRRKTSSRAKISSNSPHRLNQTKEDYESKNTKPNK
jgi:hypothetical protein